MRVSKDDLFNLENNQLQKYSAKSNSDFLTQRLTNGNDLGDEIRLPFQRV